MGSEPKKPTRGSLVELRILDLDRRGNGRGVLRIGTRDLTVKVRRGLPGALVRARWLGRRKGGFEAQLVEVLEPGPDAVEAACAHFGTCGGCAFQHLAYPAQLAALDLQVRAALEGQLAGVEVDETVGARSIWNYRNKMDFTFANRRWVEEDEPEGVESDFALGLHVPGRFQKVLDIGSCKIHFEEADALLATLRELSRDLALDPWDCMRHSGFLRHVVLRKGFRTGEIMVDLVTSSDAPERGDLGALTRELAARHPEITTLVQNVNTRPASVAVGEREHVLFGPGVIHEEVLGLRFRLSANSFFQTNTLQCDRLFEMLREEAAVRSSDVVYDLYCGTGAIGLALSAHVAAVHGWESVPDAVTDAHRNARLNGVENAHFHGGDVLEGLAGRGSVPAPDVVVLDPPRSGLHPRVVPAVVELAPRRIVYVSCNVHAAAGDIPAFAAGGYHLQRVRPIDLFPHTPHVECILTLERGTS